MTTIDFRACPSYPGYSASLCGIIMRDKPRVDGTPWFLKPLAAQYTRVILRGARSVAIDRMVADAWADLAPPVVSVVYRKPSDRPEPLYPDGRVLTKPEWIAELSK